MAIDRADRVRAGQHPQPRHLPSAQYRRLKIRRGHTHAIGAVKHTIIVAVWHTLSTGETYREAGGDYLTRPDPEKDAPRLVAQLQRLGHTVTLDDKAAA